MKLGYIEDITCLPVDMNFIFEWSTRYLTSDCSERVRYRVEHKKIKFISISAYVMYCLLYKHQWNIKSACFQRHDLLCNHNDGNLFTCEDNMLSSPVKIWSFRWKAHYRYFTGVYIIKIYKGKIKTILLILSVPKSQNSNQEEKNSNSKSVS